MNRIAWASWLALLASVAPASAQLGSEHLQVPAPASPCDWQEGARSDQDGYCPTCGQHWPYCCPTCGQAWPKSSAGDRSARRDKLNHCLKWLCYVPTKTHCHKEPNTCTPPLYLFFTCCDCEAPIADWDSRKPKRQPGWAWGSVEYLLWWIQDAPLPLPLVTTGDPNNPLAGVLDQPDTRILFGGDELDYGTFSGLRGTFGVWINYDQTIGVEASAFLLERRAVFFNAASDAGGIPPLTLPFFDPSIDAENGVFVASPIVQPFAGSISVSSLVRLWGMEFNGVLAGIHEPCFQAEWFAGFRLVSLDEGIQIYDRAQDLESDILNVLDESFKTRNRFYGGQLGGRVRWDRDILSFLLQGQIAFGGTYQVVDVQGSITQTGADAFAPGVNPGGVYAQPTNIGRQTHTVFSMLPALQAKTGVRILPHLMAWVGYDFLLLSSVVRPGEQIDRVVNPTQSPIFGDGALDGPAFPARRFDQTSFITHGVSLAFEYRW